MCNIMTPMSKILILIATMVAINGEAAADTNRPDTPIDDLSKTLSRLKLDVADYSGIDVWAMWMLRNRLIEPPQTSPPTETTTTKSIASHQGNRRNRRQALVNMKRKNGGSTSVLSIARSRLPLNVNGEEINPIKIKFEVKKWILQQLEIDMMNRIKEFASRNRNRRSATDAKISSNNNTTPSAGTMLSNRGYNMSAVKCLLSLSYPVSLPTQCIQFYFRSLFKAIH